MLSIVATGYGLAAVICVLLEIFFGFSFWVGALIFWFGGAVLTFLVAMVFRVLKFKSLTSQSLTQVFKLRWTENPSDKTQSKSTF